MSDEPVIRLVCRTGAPEGYEDMEFAVLDLTLDLALSLLKKIGVAGVFATEDGFHRVTYFDYAISYHDEVLDRLHSCEDVTDEQYKEIETNLDNCGWVEFPADIELDGMGRTECETLSVDQNSVVWKAYPKHGDRQIEGQCFMRDDLAAYAHRLMNMHATRVAKEADGSRRELRSIQIDTPGSGRRYQRR